MAIIEVKHLSKSYEFYRKEAGLSASVRAFFWREKQFAEAVKDVSFSIDEGELVGFLGPNGAGKTTTLKMLSGILNPTSGEARVMGYTPWNRALDYRRQFAIVMGQKNQLLNQLPAIDSFVLFKSIYGMSEKDFKRNLDELTELLGARDFLDIQVRKLSLGQRMKCELIAALLHKPKVLFLDEPTIGLDVVAQKNVRDFLKHYNSEQKTTILLTSHYMEDIRELCKRVIIINLGKIIYDGAFDDLIKKYAPYKMLRVTFEHDGVQKGDFAKFGDVQEFTTYSAAIRVPRAEAKRAAAALLSSSIPVDDILIDEVDADDVVRTIFKG